MKDDSSPSEEQARRRTAANLFLQVHDIAMKSLDEPGGIAKRPVVNLCNLILSEALLSKAAGIRISASEGGADIEYQIAESWRRVMRLPTPALGPLINRLKVMANLDVGKQPVQRGTLKVRLEGKVSELEIEVRLHGAAEEASLRLRTSTTPHPNDEVES